LPTNLEDEAGELLLVALSPLVNVAAAEKRVPPKANPDSKLPLRAIAKPLKFLNSKHSDPNSVREVVARS
jgi:hypothetical protein